MGSQTGKQIQRVKGHFFFFLIFVGPILAEISSVELFPRAQVGSGSLDSSPRTAVLSFNVVTVVKKMIAAFCPKA